MFQGERQSFRRRTVPRSKKNGGEKHQQPHIPHVETYKSLDVFVPNGSPLPVKKGHAELKQTKWTPSGERQSGTIFTPILKHPIFEHFRTHHGGGRIGGGGTSDESISRAKSKFRTPGKLSLK